MTLKDVKTKVVGTVAGLQLKAGLLGASVATSVMMGPEPLPVYAAKNINSKKGENAMWEIIGMVLNFTAIVGIAFVFMGAWKLIQAFRNDNNPEAMASGAKDLMVGFILIALKGGQSFFKGLVR